MTEPPPVFSPDAYVVRYGGLGVLRGVAAVAGCLTIAGVLVADHRSVSGDVVGGLFVILLGFFGVGELRKASRRDVMFAVYPVGVYFGSGSFRDNVPWPKVCAIEFFTERVVANRSTSRYACVGARSPGTEQQARPGSGPAAQPMTQRAAQYYIDAGRPDLIPGADGTVRYTYRRMTGWRVDQAQLIAAVQRFAPTVAVIQGQDYPPPLGAAEVMTARRARRGGQANGPWS
jgi:hypothetical protein